MTGLFQTSSESTGSWSLSSLISSRDSFSNQTWARFQMGGSWPALFGCHYIYFWYIIFITYAVRVSIFITSPQDWLLVCCIYKEVYLQFFKCVSFWLQSCCGKWDGWARKPLNHANRMDAVCCHLIDGLQSVSQQSYDRTLQCSKTFRFSNRDFY